MNETIYHDSGKAFPRKFRKFGDICLSEINERIVVCGLCKCLSTTLPDFWKHQRVEHNLRAYEDTEGNADYAEYERSLNAANVTKDEKSNECKSVENGTHVEPAVVDDDPLSGTFIPKCESTPQPSKNNVDAPILKKALKSGPELRVKAPIKYTAKIKKQDPKISTDEVNIKLQKEFDASPDNDNFDNFITFCCPECGIKFPGQQKLWKKHINTAHTFYAINELNITLFKRFPDGGTIYKCDICNVQLNKPNLAPLRRHKLIHMPFKSYNCRLCNAELRHKSGILHHMRSVHRRGQKKLYSCVQCQKEFISAQHYQKHIQQHPRNSAELSIKLENAEDEDDHEDLQLTNEPILPDYMDNEADFDKNNSDDDDDNFDPSPFLITEMTEEDAWTKNDDDDETNQISFNGDTNGNSPTEIIDDTDDGYTGGLWLEDDFNALLETQTKQPEKKKYKKKEKLPEIVIEPFKCEVCLDEIPNKFLYKKHLRKHGKNFDCRLCGVKISSIRALRRHYELNRCKVKGKKLSAKEKKMQLKCELDDKVTKWNTKIQLKYEHDKGQWNKKKQLKYEDDNENEQQWNKDQLHNNEYHNDMPQPMQVKYEHYNAKEQWEKEQLHSNEYHNDTHQRNGKLQYNNEDQNDEDELKLYDVEIKEEPPVEIIDTDDEFD